MKDVLYKTREAAENTLCDLVNKGFNNPQDLCSGLDAVKILAQIATIEAMERAQWTEEESRRMRGVSYGYSYNDPYWEAESMRRGRNSLGQYTSREMPPMRYDGGHSGHSINDIMIASLERSITPEMSDFERQRVMEEIRQLRERKD